MPETDILSSPAVSLLIGAFGALMLIALFRKARKLFVVSVMGLTLTIGLFILKASAYI
jgi:hypothetical protein